MENRKSAQTERRQNRSSSLSLFVFLETIHRFPSDSIALGSHNIPFRVSARKLGVNFDPKLCMKSHVIKICQTAYFELIRISSIRRFLTEDAAKTLLTSFILSRLDYCNCLLVGTPNSVIQPLQKNSKLCCKTRFLGTPPPPLNTSPGKSALAAHFRTY